MCVCARACVCVCVCVFVSARAYMPKRLFYNKHCVSVVVCVFCVLANKKMFYKIAKVLAHTHTHTLS